MRLCTLYTVLCARVTSTHAHTLLHEKNMYKWRRMYVCERRRNYDVILCLITLTRIIDANILVLQIRLTDENLLLQIVETLQIRFDGENLHRTNLWMSMDAHFVNSRHFSCSFSSKFFTFSIRQKQQRQIRFRLDK